MFFVQLDYESNRNVLGHKQENDDFGHFEVDLSHSVTGGKQSQLLVQQAWIELGLNEAETFSLELTKQAKTPV